MAVLSQLDQKLILLGLLLLPINLLSFIYPSIRRPNEREARYFRPTFIYAILISLTTILAFSDFVYSPSKHPSSELKEMRTQLSRLESLLDEKNTVLSSRVVEIEQNKKMIEEMDKKIYILQKTLNDVKVSSDGGLSVLDEKLKAMNDEIQQLWDESRRNNFNSHVSEYKTLEAEKFFLEVASKVEQMQTIINEQWIQIQQLEQSLQMTKIMSSRATNKFTSADCKKRKLNGCPVLRFRRSMTRSSHSKPIKLPDSFFLGGTISRSSLLEVANILNGIISTAQKKHHEVLIVALLGIFPLMPSNLSNKSFRLSLLGTAPSSFYSLYTLYGIPRAWNLLAVQAWFQSIFSTKDLIHFMYCLILVSSRLHLKLALIPVVCWSVEHVAKFLRRNFSRSIFYRRYLEQACVIVEANSTALSIVSSTSEIALGFLLFISLVSRQRNILQTFMYWQLLKLMYHALPTASHHRSIWAKIGLFVNPYIYCYAPFLNTPISVIQRWWFR